jgi:hypothetical protein
MRRGTEMRKVSKITNIGPNGVEIFGVGYNSPELQELRQSSPLIKYLTAVVHGDADDIREVVVETLLGPKLTVDGGLGIDTPISDRAYKTLRKQSRFAASSANGSGEEQ